MLYSQANQSSTIRKLSIVGYVNVLGVVVFKILCVVYGHGRTCQFLASLRYGWDLGWWRRAPEACCFAHQPCFKLLLQSSTRY